MKQRAMQANRAYREHFDAYGYARVYDPDDLLLDDFDFPVREVAYIPHDVHLCVRREQKDYGMEYSYYVRYVSNGRLKSFRVPTDMVPHWVSPAYAALIIVEV